MKNLKTFVPYFTRKGKPVATGLTGGKLFCVQGWEKNHHPVTCYVHAQDPKDAIQRVKLAAETVAGGISFDARRMAKFLPGLEWSAEECPQEIILCGGSCWAANSGFQG